MRHGFRMSVGADPGGVGKVNAAFAELAEKHGVSDGIRRSVNVAVDELLENVLSHGTGGRENASVVVEVELDDNRVNVCITDDGPPFDPFEMAEPDTTLSVEEREIGGLGIHLVRKLMDEVSYERRDGHNVVMLAKKLLEAKHDSAEAG